MNRVNDEINEGNAVLFIVKRCLSTIETVIKDRYLREDKEINDLKTSEPDESDLVDEKKRCSYLLSSLHGFIVNGMCGRWKGDNNDDWLLHIPDTATNGYYTTILKYLFPESEEFRTAIYTLVSLSHHGMLDLADYTVRMSNDENDEVVMYRNDSTTCAIMGAVLMGLLLVVTVSANVTGMYKFPLTYFDPIFIIAIFMFIVSLLQIRVNHHKQSLDDCKPLSIRTASYNPHGMILCANWFVRFIDEMPDDIKKKAVSAKDIEDAEKHLKYVFPNFAKEYTKDIDDIELDDGRENDTKEGTETIPWYEFI